MKDIKDYYISLENVYGYTNEEAQINILIDIALSLQKISTSLEYIKLKQNVDDQGSSFLPKTTC